MRSWLYVIAFVIAVAVGTAAAWPAQAQQLASPSEQSWLLSWIPARCCVTNNCCYRATEGQVKGIGLDRWQVQASGQILPRTDWSRDGDLWLCQCDHDGRGKWIVHPAAHARCVFPPAPGS